MNCGVWREWRRVFCYGGTRGVFLKNTATLRQKARAAETEAPAVQFDCYGRTQPFRGRRADGRHRLRPLFKTKNRLHGGGVGRARFPGLQRGERQLRTHHLRRARRDFSRDCARCETLPASRALFVGQGIDYSMRCVPPGARGVQRRPRNFNSLFNRRSEANEALGIAAGRLFAKVGPGTKFVISQNLTNPEL